MRSEWPHMEIPNAFIGRKVQPSSKEVSEKLGPAAAAWDELISWLTAQGIACTQWKSTSPKYGWALRPALKKRTILYMGPCHGCFRATFILGDRAIAAAHSASLPKAVLDEIAGSKRYAEGTGVRLMVHRASDLAAIRKLVEIKLRA